MKPTMEEVATLANVSRATVSRVLSNSTNVDPDKRRVVHEAIDTLGYQPHKKPALAGVITVGIDQNRLREPFYATILAGLQSASKKQKTQLMMDNLDAVDDGYTVSLERMTEGVVLLGGVSLAKETITTIRRRNIPVVVINGPIQEESFSYVGIEERKAMIDVVETLIKRGHQEIAYITGPENDPVYQERLRAYKIGLLCAKLSVNHQLIIHATDWTVHGGYVAAKELLQTNQPSAILATNDQMALGAYRAIREAGFKIPEQISVVGFDDIDMAKDADPPLSTVTIPLSAMGEWAIMIIHGLVRGEINVPVRLQVPTSFTLRSSVGPIEQGSDPYSAGV